MVQMNTSAHIHLDAIRRNLNHTRSLLKPGVKTMAVIKDNAYGHGLLEVARALNEDTDWFCVARAEEGVMLRKGGITNPILVFEAVMPHTADVYPAFDLTATLHETAALRLMQPGTSFHINIDTGMHRLGVLPEEIHELQEGLKSHPELEPSGIYTHFFKADDPGNNEVAEQLDLFNRVRSAFPDHWMTHTANTGAIYHYRSLDLQFDAVRPGVCLYGYGAGDVEIPELEPALDLTSFIMQVKKVKKGETVSYGGRWVVPEDGYIGIIPSGYSDGIPRVLSSSIELIINGDRFPQAGTISMDYLIVYLGDQKLSSGTAVYLLKGNEISAKDWARKAGTIPYEITTNIKHKVSRIYEPETKDQ